MKTLVTGGAGFIGSHVVRGLIDDGVEVRVLHLEGEPLTNLDGLDVEFVAGDITEPESVRRAVSGCDRVFHLAAIYALWLPRPELMREVNVEGTRNVLRAAGEAGVRKVVHTSSIAVCGGQGLDTDATEESPFALGKTGELYCQTKYESHQLALEFARDGLDVSICCPTIPYGPGDRGPTPTGRFLLEAVQMPVVFHPASVNNIVDVRDVARGHLLAAQRGRSGESYLLGHQNVPLGELVRLALEVVGRRAVVLRTPYPALWAWSQLASMNTRWISRRAPVLTPQALVGLRLGTRADCSKAFTQLGHSGRPVEQTLRDALCWFARAGYIRRDSVREHLLAVAEE